MTKKNTLTPMMQQWTHCKERAKDALLFFRLGDFYEAFYEDAKLIAKEINISLTKRQGIPMCGVPFHAADSYIAKLIAKGFKVAVAEQMENPNEVKGIVKREIVKILSPGTVMDDNLLQEKANNFFVSISQVGMIYGLCMIDLSTSELKILELESKEELTNEFYKLKPSECLISEKFKKDHKDFFETLSLGTSFVLNTKEDWYFDHQICLEVLQSHFQVQNLDGFGLKGKTCAINAAGALFSYLKEDLNLSLNHIKEISSENVSSYMSIDHICMKNLEIIESLHASTKDHTLLSVLDQTSTPMGGRLLRQWIKHPLLDPKKINLRFDAIEEFLDKPDLLKSIHEHFKYIKDIERLIMKIASGSCGAKELVALRFSLEPIKEIKKILSSCTSTLLTNVEENLVDISFIVEKIKSALVETPPLRTNEGKMFQKGYNADLDELKSICFDSKTWIANYQNRLKEELDIKTLKVGFTRAFGYYVEVSKGQVEKVPQSFHRRQTLVNAERFISEELKEFEHKILSAEDRIKALEAKLFSELREFVLQSDKNIHQIAKAIANLDALFSLAIVANNNHYVRPSIDQSDLLQIEKGRHPIIERFLSFSKFIPNNTLMDNKDNQLFLITGPNMAGKSTYIRQVALIVIMAQMGSFVPAASCHIGIIDKLFSRIGASDDLSRGQSTFMVEMSETANILHNATSSSLVILDEIGRGTSTYDGISIAWAVAEFLVSNKNKKAKTLFATHYFELTAMEKQFANIKNYNVAIKETDSGIVFLHKIVKGATDKSYGIHVAKLAGLPYNVIQNAKKRLLQLENHHRQKKKKEHLSLEKEQFSLFSLSEKQEEGDLIKKDPIIEELHEIDPNQMTPIQALQKLLELKQKTHS